MQKHKKYTLKKNLDYFIHLVTGKVYVKFMQSKGMRGKMKINGNLLIFSTENEERIDVRKLKKKKLQKKN